MLVVITVAAEARYLPAEFDWTPTGIGKSAAAISTTRAIIELPLRFSHAKPP